MTETWLGGHDIRAEEAFTDLGTETGKSQLAVDRILASRQKKPLKISVSGAVITIAGSLQQTLGSDGTTPSGTVNGYSESLSPIDGVIPDISDSTLNVSTGAVSGDMEPTPTCPASTADYYRWLGFELRKDGVIYLMFGLTESATVGGASLPIFSKSNVIASGYLLLKKNGSAGTWSFLDPDKQYVRQMPSGGMSGGSSDVSVNPADGFSELVFDKLDVTIADAASLINSTTGIYKSDKPLIELACDKTKTFSTTGTACTISGAPSFTIAAGDIIYSGTTFRRIASLSSQTSVTLDAAFPVDLSTSAGMVAQAVWGKDLINIGSATEKTRIRDFYSVDIGTIHVDYTDSLIVGDSIPDYVDEARIVCSASNEGLRTDTSTYPTSDEFSLVFTRPVAPNTINDYDLLANANKQRLFLCFFPNPSNASVTAQANLLGYECSLIEDPAIARGGVIDAAWAMTDVSQASVHADAPIVVGGKTRVRVNFSINPTTGDEHGYSEADVIVNGQTIPRFITGKSQAVYYKMIDTNTYEFWTDLSSNAWQIQIKKKDGVNNATADGLQLAPIVVAKIADYAILSTEVSGNRIFTNEGATGDVTFTLPDAVSGAKVQFVVQAAYRLIIATTAGDVIYCNGAIGLSSMYNNVKGSVLELYGTNNTEWMGNVTNQWIDSAVIGIFGGDAAPGDTIDYVVLSTTSAAIDFGNLSVSRGYIGSCGSLLKGLFGGGDSPTYSNVIDYVTFLSAGNATDFGNLTVARQSLAACSNSTRALFGGGNTPGVSDVIDYVTTASAMDAVDFGNLSVSRGTQPAACSSSTRGIFAGGTSSSDVIDYVTINSTGNATDFGNLSVGRSGVAGSSSSTRGVFGGGFTGSYSDVIDYITIATPGNASDFGNLTSARQYLGACSSLVRGLWAGGTTGSNTTAIDFVEIATLNNATSFGALTLARQGLAGCSNGHGGLA